MKPATWFVCACLALLVVAAGCDDGDEPTVVGEEDRTGGGGMGLVLPTGNEALFGDGGRAFYMHTNRTFEGKRSQPWQAGRYGFVRNPIRTDGGKVVYTRRHEGIDIRPARRDADGLAADTVRAINAGRVVYANETASHSNYGKYVVVRHEWDGSPYYSLYAHLSRITAPESTRVERGQPLGRMGYTGHGLGVERSHLHLEIGLLLNRHFQRWFDSYYPPNANKNGLYSGFNLAGFNPAAFYKALHKGTVKSAQAFIEEQKPFYKVLLPGPPPPDLTRRYPWMLPEDAPDESASWEVTLDENSVPLHVAASDSTVSRPVATWSKSFTYNLMYRALGYLTENDGRVMLTRKGLKYAELLAQKGK